MAAFPVSSRGRAVLLSAAGVVSASGALALARLTPVMGSPGFMVAVGLLLVGYLVALGLVVTSPRISATTLAVCLLAGVGWRAPLVPAPFEYSTDTIRYVWDARVQRAGLSPYVVRPDDAHLDHLHSALTRGVDAAWLPTIYPPVAQMYFRAVTAVAESPVGFRVAATAADQVLALVLWVGLAAAGRPIGLVLVYAWHPLLSLEASLGGHLDAFGALWLGLSWLALVRGRSITASVAFAAAVMVKPLPLVLAPLYWRRVRGRDLAAALAFTLGATWWVAGWAMPSGSFGTFVDTFRFNGPLFASVSQLLPPRVAAGGAVILGGVVAGWLRATRPPEDPAAWAWPMAVALALGPVIYPWYLIWLLPFLLGRQSLPLWVWSLSILCVYPTWWRALAGGEWAVPSELLVFEYGLFALAVAELTVRPFIDGLRRARSGRAPGYGAASSDAPASPTRMAHED